MSEASKTILSIIVKLNYCAETDSLYIDLSDRTSVDSKEVAPGVVLDFDEAGALVGIDIDNASKIVNLSTLEIDSLPVMKGSQVGLRVPPQAGQCTTCQA